MKVRRLVWKKTAYPGVDRWTAAREDGLLPSVMVIFLHNTTYHVSEVSGGLFQTSRHFSGFYRKLTTAKREAATWHNRNPVR